MAQRFLAREIYEFFLQNINNDQAHLLSLDDFLKTCPGYLEKDNNGNERMNYSMVRQTLGICKKMVEDSLLISLEENNMVPMLNKYLSIGKVNATNPDAFQNEIDYGSYDFKYQGFPFTRNYFFNSVLPIVGINKNGDSDIGTAYFIGDNKFVTAAHCVTDLVSFNLLDHSCNPMQLKEIWYMKDRNKADYDLAVICIEGNCNIQSFQLEDLEILEEILVMGYPPIPGLNPILTAETASVGATIDSIQKGDVGEVVSNASTYFHNLQYFLINARVKGGNSGSPVINKTGRVIGTVVQIPLDSLGGISSVRFDVMGYGICLPSKYLKDLILNAEIHKLEFTGSEYILQK